MHVVITTMTCVYFRFIVNRNKLRNAAVNYSSFEICGRTSTNTIWVLVDMLLVIMVIYLMAYLVLKESNLKCDSV